MINFRYHVVSLTAVFLALAIGLVVGTAALNGPVADTLKGQVDLLGQQNTNLRQQVNELHDANSRADEFASQAAPSLIGGKLAGRDILVVVLPGAESYADGVTSMLTIAGAKVTGQVTVSDKFIDPANGTELLYIADRASQPSVPASGLPLNSDGVETSSALLATALLARTPAVTSTDLKAVLSAYSSAGYVAATDGTVGGGEATVVVSGPPATGKDADARNQAAVTLTTQFARYKPLVVAGSGIGDGNLVAEVRGDPTLVKSISTVDNASTAQGQLVTALAAAERIVAGRAGQYGLSAGAASLMPKAAA